MPVPEPARAALPAERRLVLLHQIAAAFCEQEGVGKSCSRCREKVAGFMEAVDAAGLCFAPVTHQKTSEQGESRG